MKNPPTEVPLDAVFVVVLRNIFPVFASTIWRGDSEDRLKAITLRLRAAISFDVFDVMPGLQELGGQTYLRDH